MRLGGLRYLIKQGWRNMGANRLMTFAGVGVLTACFLITGIAALLSMNVGRVVDHLASLNEIIITVKMDVDDAEAEGYGVQLRALPNVQDAEFISKAAAFDEVKDLLSDYGEGLMDGIDHIFPAKYNVTVQDINYIDETDAQIRALDWVERTYVSKDITSIMLTIRNAVTYGGWGLVIVLAVVSVIVISNTIRLTVFARRREISIMKYVGATNTFIRLPFFVEGMTVGIIAGVLATGIICGVYYLVYEYIRSMYNVWIMSLMDSLIPLGEIWYLVAVGTILLGMLLGGVGTAFSVRKHLKV